MSARLLPAACGVLITGGLFLITWAYAAASSNPGAVAFAVLLAATLVAGALTGQFLNEVIRTHRDGTGAGNDTPADRVESFDDALRLILDWLKKPLLEPEPVANDREPDATRAEKQEPTL